jgi:hypothetical protein
LGTPPPLEEAQIAEQLFGHPFLVNTPPDQVEQILAGFSVDPALRDPDGDWVVVEMRLRDEGSSSRLVWANGGGGVMTECPTELARWLAPI